MIATITAQPHRMSHHEHLYANAASAPLPIIPRRTASATRQTTVSPSLSYTIKRSTPSINTSVPSVLKPSSSSSSESETSSSGGSRPTIRARRIRGIRPQAVCPPELSTPIPTFTQPQRDFADTLRPPPQLGTSKTEDNITYCSPMTTAPTRPLIYTPGMPLRLNVEALNPRKLSTDGSKSVPCEAEDGCRAVRKKSGRVLKSSLKTSKSAGGSLSVMTFTQPSKSEPTTPTGKAVHFDAKLEHVKLFLAEQKPLAVSRDGSPTDDTSGTDSDFPPFIFGDDDRRSRRNLVMNVVNMPPRINTNADVLLEDFCLSQDRASILGRIRVRNLAYAKWVVVRFTFDCWRTTSEVTAKYLESIGPEFDRFSFSIRLNDLLARIEGKTLILAVRYSVTGQEIWDNNNSQNYVAKFSRAAPRERSLSDDEYPSDLTDLHDKLEKVVQGKERTGPAFMAQQTRLSAEPEEAPFKSTASLASRYDWSASLKSPWKYHDSLPSHIRTQSYPQVSKSPAPSSIPFPPRSALIDNSSSTPSPSSRDITSLGSPRDLGDGDIYVGARVAANLDEGPFSFPTRDHGMRNHKRGYFDVTSLHGHGLKKTPPGTPIEKNLEGTSPFLPSFGSRSYSFPPIENKKLGPAAQVDGVPRSTAMISGLFADTGFDSPISTPSLATPTSSRSGTPSPTDVFMSLPLLSDFDDSPSPEIYYRDFLNQFCFFTSPGSMMNSPFDVIPRTHSASDIEDFLSSTSSRSELHAQMMTPNSPPRSSSVDDLTSVRSGSLTPTVSRMMLSESRSATPVAL